MKNREKEIIRGWGSDAEYFKEYESFLMQHQNADCQTYDSEKCLLSVTYYFKPYTVWADNQRLMQALREASEKGAGENE
jgi:hypothetical protein